MAVKVAQLQPLHPALTPERERAFQSGYQLAGSSACSRSIMGSVNGVPDASLAAETIMQDRKRGRRYSAAMTNFASENRIAEIAVMIGDVSRATILCALMDGRAFTAGELAAAANISAQTASSHLSKMTEAGMIDVVPQGRHRYFRIASSEVADVLENLSVLAAGGPKRFRPPGPKDEALRTARSCYDHLAGRLAVAVADSLQSRGHVSLAGDAPGVSADGKRFLFDFGVDLDRHGGSRRELCRACLDWSERRFHIGGRLGAALMARFEELNWIRRTSAGRVLTITRAGESGFADEFGYIADNVTRLPDFVGEQRLQSAE